MEKKDKEHEKTLDTYKTEVKSLKGIFLLLLKLFFLKVKKLNFSADKTSLTQQRQKLMNKSNVIERLGVNATQLGGKSMTPGESDLSPLVPLFTLLSNRIALENFVRFGNNNRKNDSILFLCMTMFLI